MRTLLLSITLTLSIGGGVHAQGLDIELLRSVHVERSTAMDGPFEVITHSAVPIAFVAPASFLVTGLIRKDSNVFWEGVAMVGGLAFTTGITYGTKYLVQRPRPYESHPEIIPLTGEGTPSFPSGHTSTSFSLATNLTIAIPKWYVATPAFLWAGAVGYSRMHLGVHYPSDVLIGAAVGAGSAWLSHIVTERVLRR